MTGASAADDARDPASSETSPRELSNPPLQEVLFEFRWALQEGATASGTFPVDPYYRIAVGRFFDRASKGFPKYETLPTLEMPDQIAAYVLQHRWARAEGSPILQIGPGVLSVNETRPREYRWPEFRQTCIEAYQSLNDSYPVPLLPYLVSFVYINSIPFDFVRRDALDFIASSLNGDVIGTRRVLPPSVARSPVHFQSAQAFRCSSPDGVVSIAFESTVVQQADKAEKRLMWQLLFQTRGPSVPNGNQQMTGWMNDSHAVLEAIFFNMIKGNMERVFA